MAKFIVSSDSRVRNQHKNFTRFGSLEVRRVPFTMRRWLNENVKAEDSFGNTETTRKQVDSILIQADYIAGSPASMMSLTLEDATKLYNALAEVMTCTKVK